MDTRAWWLQSMESRRLWHSWLTKEWQQNNPLSASLVAHVVKNLLTVQETRIWSLGWEDPLEKGMATHSSILAWRIPWTEEPGRLQAMGLQKVGHNCMADMLNPLSWGWSHVHAGCPAASLASSSKMPVETTLQSWQPKLSAYTATPPPVESHWPSVWIRIQLYLICWNISRDLAVRSNVFHSQCVGRIPKLIPFVQWTLPVFFHAMKVVTSLWMEWRLSALVWLEGVLWNLYWCFLCIASKLFSWRDVY